ncbi:MAG: DUF4432 family protein [Lautropia sp.]
MAELWGTELSRRALMARIGRLEQVAGVTLGQYVEGPERGVRYADLRSGSGLELRVLIDRGFDPGELRVGGVPVAWRSPNGFRAPALHDAEEMDGTGLLRSIDGLMLTGGLDHVRGPAEGPAGHFGTRRETVRYPLHGRLSAQPARLTGHGERWDGDRCVIWCEGEVRQTMLYGEHLVLTRRYEIELGRSRIDVFDRIENAGHCPTPHQLLYHVNFGFPLIGERTALQLSRSLEARADAAALAAIAAPSVPGRIARDELLDLDLDATGAGDGWQSCAIANPGLAGGLAIEVSFASPHLTRLQIWRNRSPGVEVLAVEPATHPAQPRGVLDAGAAIAPLDPGEVRDYRLAFSAHTGEPALAVLQSRLAHGTMRGPDGEVAR